MSALSDVAVAVLLGGLLAAGLLLVLAAFPRWRWANLSTRIAPHVRDVADLTDPTERLPWRMPAGDPGPRGSRAHSGCSAAATPGSPCG